MKTELLEIAKEVINVNKGALLSGSLAINLQGYSTRREPTDIDIICPFYESKFTPINGMKVFDSSDQYSESNYSRLTFKYDDIKIDIFFPVTMEDYSGFTTTGKGGSGIQMLTADEILKFKVEHVFDTEYPESQSKHSLDLLYMFAQKAYWNNPAKLSQIKEIISETVLA